MTQAPLPTHSRPELENQAMTDSHRRLITAPLLQRESIGSLYHVLSFDVPEGVAVRAGQFCMVRGAEWGDAPLLPRPMSFLTGGTSPSILIKVIGEGTRRMARAEPGEPFRLLGPLGKPWRAADPTKRQVLVAGGVGIAPLLSWARELKAAGQSPLAVYGGRSAHDLPLEDDLSEICETLLTTEDGSRGARGRVTEVLAETLAAGDEVYTCGPDRMMAAVAAICEQRDIPCEVSLETPMACGYGVCLGCPVKLKDGAYAYACTEGPCMDSKRIDWTLGGKEIAQ